MEFAVISIGQSMRNCFTVRVPVTMRQTISDSGKTVNGFYRDAVRLWANVKGIEGVKTDSDSDLVIATSQIIQDTYNRYGKTLNRSEASRMVLSHYIMATKDSKKGFFTRLFGKRK